MELVKIIVSEIISSDAAVSADSGDKVFERIDREIGLKIVELDFSNITMMTTAFLNAAIGQLYSKYTSEQLNKNLKLVNVDNDDKILFKKVVERAKQYFADKSNLDDSVNKVFYGK